MAKETVYELFDKFLEKLKKGESMFSKEGVFTENNIKDLYERIVDNSIGTASENKKEHEKILGKVKEITNDVDKDKLPVKVNFDRKIEYQLGVGLFKGVNQADKGVLELFANLIWLRYLPINGIGVETKLKKIRMLFSEEDVPEVNDIFFPKEGVASYGMLQQQIFEDLEALIELFKKVITELDKPFIEVLEGMVKNPKGEESKFHERPIINMLQHLCGKEKYVNCASYSHKKDIVKAFAEPLNVVEDESFDITISSIKEELLAISSFEKTWKKNDNKFRSFYHKQIRQFWDFQGIDTKEDFSELKALKFKKSIVFYGPPGTSKTYNAKKLAEILIRQAFIKENVKKALDTDFEDEYENRISNLQLHANYSYEDFIIGMRIEGDNTVWEEGWLLKKINKINEENELLEKENKGKLPYVIILDEINRVDLSRLFGELFSAIENRNQTVTLSAMKKSIDNNGKAVDVPYTINIPSNLYFIGTMNEIDFSLERIDFALRRRFVWYFYGYNEDTLKTIVLSDIERNNISKNKYKEIYSNLTIPEKKFVDEKMSNENSRDKNQFFREGDLEEFIKRATALNKTLEDDEDFGKQWQIGHTFFAEIIEISETVNEKSLFVKPKESKKFTKAKRPVEILWSISIQPMLEAYCGNLDKESKKKKLDIFKDIFLKGGNGKSQN
ncbi:MAG: AAA domain-containing protein [Polaribacter sp.]|jgi:5-methylcytosine-specific restriction enzyme B|nr:AAA domain-containing protein [Polaribacter sp.]